MHIQTAGTENEKKKVFIEDIEDTLVTASNLNFDSYVLCGVYACMYGELFSTSSFKKFFRENQIKFEFLRETKWKNCEQEDWTHTHTAQKSRPLHFIRQQQNFINIISNTHNRTIVNQLKKFFSPNCSFPSCLFFFRFFFFFFFLQIILE